MQASSTKILLIIVAFVALSAIVIPSAIAKVMIQTADLADGAVTTPKLADGAVTSFKLATDSVKTINIKDGNIVTSKLADGTVTDVKLAAAAVKAVNIVDGNVLSSKLADGSVTSAKLASGAVRLVVTTKVSNAFTVPADGGQLGTVTCDAGSKAIGGGYSISATDGSVVIGKSVPGGSAGDEWDVAATNSGASDAAMLVYAQCASLTP